MDAEGLKQDIRSLEEDVEKMFPEHRAAQFKLFLDRFMPLALIMLVSLVVFHLFIPVSDSMAVAISYLNILVLGFFSVRFVLALLLADSREKFLRQHWFDGLLVLPAFALVKDMRLLLAVESKTEERALIGYFFARNTTVAGQITKIYTWVRRILRL